MSKNIELSYIWDRDTYLKASKLAYDYELKRSNKKYIGWLFIALTQFGVVAAMQKGSIGLLLISTILVLYWYYLRWPLRERFIKKSFKKLPNADMRYVIKILNDNFYINDKEIEWEKISEVLALEDGVFVYLGNDSIFVPNSAFKKIEDRNDFLTILKSKVDNYTRVN